MVEGTSYLAIDLGAESGRIVHGWLEGGRLHLDEIHRFPNKPVLLPDAAGRTSLRWDILYLWREIMEGISRFVREMDVRLAGIGLDTWGVDFCLLDKRGEMLHTPYHYRDSRTDGMVEKACAILPRRQIFEQTGIQFMQINTLFQLFSMAQSNAPELAAAETLLTIPDLFNFWLTGKRFSEFTIATTTQCFNPTRRDWAWDVLDALGIPRRIFPAIIPPGTVLGPVQPAIAKELGLDPANPVQVIAPACHDTGSAAAAIPAEVADFAWISSGTWSVMGTNMPEPVINDQSLQYNFTNEGGVGGKYRFSKNIMGLWLVQQCRRTWAAGGEERSYGELTEMAAAAKPFVSFVDPDDPSFLQPGDMPSRIRQFCRRTGQPEPEEKGAVVRAALEGIALKYRWVLERLEDMTGKRLNTIHIVGGGTQNRLLSQFTADCTRRRVVTGPIEATAAGNILTQALALGHISSPSECPAIIHESFPVDVFEPGDPSGWDEAYQRLLRMIKP